MNIEILKEELFSKIGIDTDWIVAGVAVVLLLLFLLQVISLVKLRKMKKRYKKFMNGQDGKSMEAVIQSRFEQIDELKESDTKRQEDIDLLMNKFSITYQKLGLVKYDAYREMGGELSFALTLLDQEDNGFLLNSVHNREGNYCYVKHIINGVSKMELSEEEEKSLFMAIHGEK